VFGGGIARILMMTVPAMLEEFLREFHAPSVVTRDKIAAKYGITFLPEAPLRISREVKNDSSVG
jgi:hypothetical protein